MSLQLPPYLHGLVQGFLCCFWLSCRHGLTLSLMTCISTLTCYLGKFHVNSFACTIAQTDHFSVLHVLNRSVLFWTIQSFVCNEAVDCLWCLSKSLSFFDVVRFNWLIKALTNYLRFIQDCNFTHSDIGWSSYDDFLGRSLWKCTGHLLQHSHFTNTRCAHCLRSQLHCRVAFNVDDDGIAVPSFCQIGFVCLVMSINLTNGWSFFLLCIATNYEHLMLVTLEHLNCNGTDLFHCDSMA